MTSIITTHQAPSGGNTALPRGPEAEATGREVEPHSPAVPSRPDAHQRVTNSSPFNVEQDVHDEDWTVTIGLTDDAARQLARDFTGKHMADLVALAHMRKQERDCRRFGEDRLAAELSGDVRQIEARLAGALQSMATTQWVLTPLQAEELLDDLEDANAEPTMCAVGTCSAFAIDVGSYCAPHEDGV